jgi:hypothetical protein
MMGPHDEVPPPTNYAILFTAVGVIAPVPASFLLMLAVVALGPFPQGVNPPPPLVWLSAAILVAALVGPAALVVGAAAIVFGRRSQRAVLVTGVLTYVVAWAWFFYTFVGSGAR